jgi:hypothetical protein
MAGLLSKSFKNFCGKANYLETSSAADISKIITESIISVKSYAWPDIVKVHLLLKCSKDYLRKFCEWRNCFPRVLKTFAGRLISKTTFKMILKHLQQQIT